MLTGRAKVSSKGWVVIPKEIRAEMKLKSGDEVSFFYWPPLSRREDAGSEMLRLLKAGSKPAVSLRGKYKGRRAEQPWTETLLEERRQELKREERKTEHWAQRRKTRKTSA